MSKAFIVESSGEPFAPVRVNAFNSNPSIYLEQGEDIMDDALRSSVTVVDSRQTSELSRFIREGTPEEKSEVFGRVIESAIKDQKDVVDNTQDSAIVDYSDCDFDDSSQELVGEDENCVRFNPNGTATNFGKPIIDTTADSKRKQCRHGLILYGDRCLNCEREDAVAESGHGS